MDIKRRDILRLFGTSAAILATRGLAAPGNASRIVVGFPPGGPVDIAARFIAPMLGEHLGRAFVVENRPGESGNLATGHVASAPADGHTLLLCGPVNAINTSLFTGLPFDFSRDLSAVSGLYSVPLVVEVHPGLAVRSAAELVALAKARPGQLRVGYAGKGTPQHIAIELFKAMAGVDVQLVPYLGSAPALADLLEGRIDAMFDPLPSSIEHIRAGRLRPLAVTGSQPVAMLPEVLPMSRVVPGYEAGSWFGLCAPRETPKAMIDTLHAACGAALQAPASAKRIQELGGTPLRGTPADFAAFIEAETRKYARIIEAAGIERIKAPARAA